MHLLISDEWAEVQAYLAQSTAPLIFDIETTSLTVGKGQILCVAFAPYDRDDVMVWWPQSLEDIAKLRIKRGVAHNSPFDKRWLTAHGSRISIYWDTMFMAHLLDENHPIGLKELGQRLLGYKDWAQDDVSEFGTTFGQMWSERRLPAKAKKRVSIYAGKDVHITRELMKWQKAYIRKNLKPGENPVRVMQEIMIPAIEPLTQMEDNRLPVRTKMVASAREKVEARIHEIEKTLDASIPPKDQWPEWLQKTKPKWGSTNWTKWWLYEYQGALCPSRGKPTKTWPEGNPSLSQEALSKIDHPAARLLSERSTLYKNLTGFLVPLTDRVVDGKVSTSFKLTGTVTGRLSSSSPGADNPGINSQQIPRDKATRNLFGEKGRAWIEADFSQLELRVAAVMANERTMIGLFEAGEDIHQYMAERLVRGGEVTKEHRSLAKGVNFGFLYGMHAKHFADYLQESYGVIITSKEAEAFREEYFNTFSALPEWYRKQRKFALEHGGVPNAFGRFRHLPRVYNDDYWVQENAFRQAINAPVQSTGSDFMLISLARLARDLRLRDLGAKLVTTVHDSVCLTAPYKTARKVARIIKETMEMADDGLEQKYFLKADVTISRCWGGEPLAEY
ncbi:DNA polymerase [Microbacterium phage Schubert]|uniref:DNA polymerase I n=1 Tax=Microbacterium phage Schubert TaxID=2500787 RepID=A0A3Q9RAM5_9CAUD|nr:DNA polymerase [Microbacterium phage Schubert]AZV01743.1 DNA polymerase I [Microbacterium phage Schubert]